MKDFIVKYKFGLVVIAFWLGVLSFTLVYSACHPAAAEPATVNNIVRRELIRFVKFKTGVLLIVNTVHADGSYGTATVWAPSYPTCGEFGSPIGAGTVN